MAQEWIADAGWWDGNSGWVTVTCPPKTVMVGATMGNYSWVTNFNNIFCQSIDDLVAKRLTGVVKVTPPPNAMWGGTQTAMRMPAGFAVTGANIWSQGRLDSLQYLGKDVAQLRSSSTAAVGWNPSQYQGAPSCQPNSFVVGLHAAPVTGGNPSTPAHFSMLCQDMSAEIYAAMAGANAPREDALKCLGVEMYELGETTFPAAQCNQYLSHYCPSTSDRLMDCSNTNFCNNNRAFCDDAYNAICNAVTADSPDTLKKFCACSLANPALTSIPGYNPACHNGDCFKDTAYHTAEMNNQRCNNLVVCLQEILLRNVQQADLSNITFTNNCGSGASTTSPGGAQINNNSTTVGPASAAAPVPANVVQSPPVAPAGNMPLPADPRNVNAVPVVSPGHVQIGINLRTPEQNPLLAAPGPAPVLPANSRLAELNNPVPIAGPLNQKPPLTQPSSVAPPQPVPAQPAGVTMPTEQKVILGAVGLLVLVAVVATARRLTSSKKK